MMYTMQSLIKSIVLIILLVSCNSETKNLQSTQIPQQWTILLDLSDRISFKKAPGQATRDTLILKEVASLFEKKVKSKMIIKSNDQFIINIAGDGSFLSSELEFALNQMTLIMSEIPVDKRRIAFDDWKKNISRNLQRIYSETPYQDSYTGADIWSFVDRFSSQITPTFDQRLFILTDGYLEFSSSIQQKRYQGTSGLTVMKMSEVRNHKDWKTAVSKGDLALRVTSQNLTKVKVFVSEVTPKNLMDPDEGNRVNFYLKSWFENSNVGEYQLHFADKPINQVLPNIRNFFERVEK